LNEYITCNSFNQNVNIENSFSIFQKELLPIKNMKLKPQTVEYKCSWYPTNIDNNRPFVVVPIKDSSELLKYTLENFKKNCF
jgi:hypothetical protein